MPFDLTLQEARERFPGFQIIRKLRRSGQKVAFEARKKGLHVALKILPPDCDIDRLWREIEAMVEVSSEYVAKLYECEMRVTPERSLRYLVEEFIDGEDLESRLQRGEGFDSRTLVRFLCPLLEGLEAIWAKRIVHRDIKPANIMCRASTGAPVIVDFGIARHVDRTSITPSYLAMGPCTPRYAAPEVVANMKRQISSRSDLFSLGVVSYEMLVGVHPYLPSPHLLRDIPRILQEATIVPPQERDPSIPWGVSRFVLKLMEKHPHRRFRDPSHARRTLAQLAGRLEN